MLQLFYNVIRTFIIYICCNTAYAGFFDLWRQPAQLETLEGQTITQEELKDHWVIINYWASWCKPCVEEISAFNRLKQQHPDYYIFAVNYDTQQLSKQKRLAQRFHLKYPSLKPSVATVLHLDPINVVPTTLIFNPQGKLHSTLYGGQTIENINDEISH